MDDGVDYTHPDLMHNYVCKQEIDNIFNLKIKCNSRMQLLVMILVVMIDIHILVIQMIGLIGKWLVYIYIYI